MLCGAKEIGNQIIIRLSFSSLLFNLLTRRHQQKPCRNTLTHPETIAQKAAKPRNANEPPLFLMSEQQFKLIWRINRVYLASVETSKKMFDWKLADDLDKRRFLWKLPNDVVRLRCEGGQREADEITMYHMKPTKVLTAVNRVAMINMWDGK